MNKRLSFGFLALGLVLVVAAFTASASAACGDANRFAANLHRQSWQGAAFPP